MEKESKSCTGVLLRADLTGHGQFSQSANVYQKKGGMAVPCWFSPQKDAHGGFQLFFYYVLLKY